MQVHTVETYLFLCVKVFVVLAHFLRRPLLDQTAAQQPDAQADQEHADVRDEHSDAVPCICANNTVGQTGNGGRALRKSRCTFPMNQNTFETSDVAG